MSRLLRYTVWFFTGAAILFFAGPAQAVTSAGPYYAVPAWDQKLQCDTQATCPRFVVLSNWSSEAVLDRETGLVWEQSPNTTTREWQAFNTSCARKTVGNRKGWRLPTIQELASLVDPTQSNPALPAGHPFSNVQSSPGDAYWSASTLAGGAAASTVAWIVEFFNANVSQKGKSGTAFDWCVRGGEGVDPQ